MRPFFMSYVQGEDRGQAALLPAAIEDYVAADAPVRVIDAFVDGLDVRGLGFGRSVPAVIGRPPYDLRDLLKLYLYGYLNEVRSSRRLERECSRNVEVMWLLRRLAPDFKTIADFRRDNGAAIVGTCRAFVLFCRDQGLFAARLVALDGSKFRAAASAKRVIGRREIAEEAAHLDRRIAEYLAGLTSHADGGMRVTLNCVHRGLSNRGRSAAKRWRCLEFPFGTIKRMTADGRFLTRGLKKTRAEAALMVLIYHIHSDNQSHLCRHPQGKRPMSNAKKRLRKNEASYLISTRPLARRSFWLRLSEFVRFGGRADVAQSSDRIYPLMTQINSQKRLFFFLHCVANARGGPQ